MAQVFLHSLDVIPTLDRSYCICVVKIVEPSFRMAQFDHDSFEAVVYRAV